MYILNTFVILYKNKQIYNSLKVWYLCLFLTNLYFYFCGTEFLGFKAL